MDKYESLWYPGTSVIWFSCRHKFSLMFFDNFLEFQRQPRFSVKRLRRCGGFKLEFFVFFSKFGKSLFVRLPMIPLYEQEVIYFYRRARWLSGKRFLRNRVRKENILSRNCSKYIFLSLCPNNDIERSIFVWRRWYSGEHSCLPSSRHGFLLNLFRQTSRTAVQIILHFLTFGLCYFISFGLKNFVFLVRDQSLILWL